MCSSCSLENLENQYVIKGRDKDLALECLQFPINARFMERFWHLSKYFFILADSPMDYLKTLFTRDAPPTVFISNTTPSIFSLVLVFLSNKDRFTYQTHEVNMTQMLHTIHYYRFVQNHFHRTNPLVHVISRLQYANNKLTLPYYID